jgi:hypothetical protein
MGTPRQLTQIAFAAPLDESTEDEILDPTAGFPVLQNVRQDRRGGLSKRLGFTNSYGVERLGNSDRGAGYRLFEHAGAPCTIDGEYLDTYSETLGQWIAVGRIPECSYRMRPVPTASSAPQVGDLAVAGGYIAVVSQRDVLGQPTACVLDADSGVVIRQPEDLGTVAGHVIIASYGTTFIACVSDYSTGEIISYKLDTSADLATGWALVGTVVATSAGAISSTGALPSICGLTSSVALVYGTTSGTNRVTVSLLTSAGTGVTTTIATASTTVDDIDIDGADVLWVAWGIEGGTNEAYAVALNTTTLVSVGTVATVENFAECVKLGICAGTTAQTARAFVYDTALGGNIDTADLTISAGAVVAATGTRIYNAAPASRPLCIAGRYYMAFAPSPTDTYVSGNTEQALCVVCDWTENNYTVRPIANVEPGLIPSISRSSKIAALGSSKYAFVTQFLKSGSATYTGFSQSRGTIGLALVELDFVDIDRWRTTPHGDVTFIGGGITSTYDGSRIVEAGFTSRPLTPTTDVTSGTGETVATGWRYVAIYEDVDAAGNWAVSGISNPGFTGAFTNKTSIVGVPPLSVTSRFVGGSAGSARVAFYRTTDGGAPPYYRLAAVAIDPSDDLISYNDIIPDTTLTTYAKLYAPSLPSTPGSSLDRRAPPGLIHLVSYAGMLVGARASSLYWSGQPVYGEATWFSPVFQTTVVGAAAITALAVQDGTLFIFTADGVWAVGGEIPADNGTAGGLGTPRRLAIDVGCIAASSVVVTSAGIFFQSRRGIELLNGGRATWIGEKVLRTLASYPIVTSAVIDAGNNLVRFSLAQSLEPTGAVTGVNGDDPEDGTGGGRDIVFDLTFGDWQSVDDKGSTSPHTGSQHAAVLTVDGAARYAWLSSSGVVYVENASDDATAYLDPGSEWITMSAETGWFKLAGIQGRQQFNLLLTLFRKHTPCDLSVEIGYEYRTAYDTAIARTHAQLAAVEALGVPLQLRNDPNDDAEGQAIRVRITDVTPTTGTIGTGRGATWLALTCDITPREGPAEVPEEAA